MWLSRVLNDLGHEVNAIAPFPHYRMNKTLADSFNSFKKIGLAETGGAGEVVFRSPFLILGDSLSARVIAQAVNAVGAIATVAVRQKEVRESDVVLGTVPAIPTAFISFLVAKIFRKSLVIDLRDAWPDLLDVREKWNESTGKRSLRERIFSQGPAQLLSFIVKHALFYVLDHADGIVVTSEELAQSLELRGLKSGARCRRIFTIPNVFPSAPGVEDIVRQASEHEELRVLYAGTLGRAQNLQNAIQAVELANSCGANVRLRFVGAGAAQPDLVSSAAGKDSVEFLESRSLSELKEQYLWADTALVHLAGWGPLKMAVPSKTFELISLSLHISGVVEGEAARLISDLEVGTVVKPDDPDALAEMWIEMFNDRSRLGVGTKGIRWLEEQRNVKVPMKLSKLMAALEKKGEE